MVGLLLWLVLGAALCGAGTLLLEKLQGQFCAVRALRRGLWPLGAAVVLLPFLARSFALRELAALGFLVPLSAFFLLAVQGCFLVRRGKTGKTASLLAAAGIAAFCLFLELVPFQVNYWASRNYTPSELLQQEVSISAQNRELVLQDLDLDARNLHMAFTPADGAAATKVQVSYQESAFPGRDFTLDDPWLLFAGNENSHSFNLHLDGRLNQLRLEFAEDAELTVTSLTANQPRPLQFSLIRFLCLVVIGCFGFALRPGSALWQTEYLRRTRGQKWLCRVVLGGMAVLFFVLAYSTPQCGHLRIRGLNQQGGGIIGWESDSGSDASLQYELLAESLAHGHVALEVEPDPRLMALDNPYDLDARTASGANYIWDSVYYNGHYYVYFGVVPVLLLYLPVYLATGHHMDTATACLGIGILFLLGMALLVRAMIQRWFPKASVGAYLVTLLAGAFLGGMPGLIGRPDVYEVAITCAVMFLVWGFAAWIMASRPCAHRRLWLFLGGVCLALVAGCRPQVVLFAVLILPLFGQEYLLQKRLFTKKGALDFACAIAPFVVVAAGLMAYNAVRFGSPFDFGANYNLTSLDMTGRTWQPGRIGQAVWNYLLAMPAYTPVFPFIQAEMQTAFHGFTMGDAAYGGLYAARPLLLMVLGAFACKQELRKKKLGGVLACWLAVPVLLLSIDVLMTDMNLRYAADFATPLVLASMLVFLQGEELLRAGRKSRYFRLGTVVLLAVSVGHSLLVLAQSQSPWFTSNPMLYFNLQQTLMFWR